jgi:hypothetical protein
VRYRGGLEDERRLFYVAVTRAQKFLHMSWAPQASNQTARAPSDFFSEVLASKYVKRRVPNYETRKRSNPRPKSSVANVTLSFSDLKYFFECPYQFKLRVLYGFNAPLDQALGFGKSLHDALAEVHARALRGEAVTPGDAVALVQRHLRAPYAYPALRDKLEQAARRIVEGYIRRNAAEFYNLEFSEKAIEIALGDGVSVAGLPDVTVQRAKKKEPEGQPLYEVELKGLDLFDPELMETESISGESVPCWMLDTDYDGLCFYATQVFFPKTSAWNNLQRSLKATFDDSVWSHLAGTVSEPFPLGERRRVAVRVIDERGNELMRVLDVRSDQP